MSASSKMDISGTLNETLPVITSKQINEMDMFSPIVSKISSKPTDIPDLGKAALIKNVLIFILI